MMKPRELTLRHPADPHCKADMSFTSALCMLTRCFMLQGQILTGCRSSCRCIMVLTLLAVLGLVTMIVLKVLHVGSNVSVVSRAECLHPAHVNPQVLSRSTCMHATAEGEAGRQ